VQQGGTHTSAASPAGYRETVNAHIKLEQSQLPQEVCARRGLTLVTMHWGYRVERDACHRKRDQNFPG